MKQKQHSFTKGMFIEKRAAYAEKKTLLTAERRGGSIMLQGCMAARGRGSIARRERRIDSTKQILEANAMQSGRKLKMRRDIDSPGHSHTPLKPQIYHTYTLICCTSSIHILYYLDTIYQTYVVAMNHLNQAEAAGIIILAAHAR